MLKRQCEVFEISIIFFRTRALIITIDLLSGWTISSASFIASISLHIPWSINIQSKNSTNSKKAQFRLFHSLEASAYFLLYSVVDVYPKAEFYLKMFVL